MRQVLQDYALRSAVIFACLSSLPGCFAIYGHKDIKVSVVDALTESPVENARIHVYYLFVLTLNAPHPVDATTSSDGTATMHVATFQPCRWEVVAPGYGHETGRLYKSEPPEGEQEQYLLLKDQAANVIYLRK